MLNTVVVGPRQYSDAKRRLKLWAKTEDAWTCVWQCARYLRQALFADWGLYTPWAVFLTTVRHCFLMMVKCSLHLQLVCRAYNWTSATPESTSQRRQHPTTYSTAHLPIIDRQATIIAWLDKILQTPGRHESTDGEVDALIEYVAGQLELGESTARENAAMLRMLIGHKR